MEPNPADEPLIYTSKGNLPLASLEYRHYRRDQPGVVVLVEEWWLGEELVKNNVHALPLVGLCLEGIPGAFGG